MTGPLTKEITIINLIKLVFSISFLPLFKLDDLLSAGQSPVLWAPTFIQ